MNNKIEFNDVFKATWSFFKLNLKELIVASLISMAAYILLTLGFGFLVIMPIYERVKLASPTDLSNAFDILNTSDYVGIVAGIVAMVLLAVILSRNWASFTLAIVRGEQVHGSGILSRWDKLGRYVLNSAAAALAMIAGFVLLIAPGVYLALRFAFVPVASIDDRVGGSVGVFSLSSSLTQGYKLFMLAVGMVITGAATGIGIALNFVSVLVSLFAKFTNLEFIDVGWAIIALTASVCVQFTRQMFSKLASAYMYSKLLESNNISQS